ncbi:MAG: hypothetical protein ACT4O2_09745 [Beijerinckiaceae bacterium]
MRLASSGSTPAAQPGVRGAFFPRLGAAGGEFWRFDAETVILEWFFRKFLPAHGA